MRHPAAGFIGPVSLVRHGIKFIPCVPNLGMLVHITFMVTITLISHTRAPPGQSAANRMAGRIHHSCYLARFINYSIIRLLKEIHLSLISENLASPNTASSSENEDEDTSVAMRKRQRESPATQDIQEKMNLPVTLPLISSTCPYPGA